MLVQVRQRIKVLIRAGKTIDETVAAAPTKDFDAKWGSGYVPPDVFTKMVFSSLASSGSASLPFEYSLGAEESIARTQR
jgi:hypothetical protein